MKVAGQGLFQVGVWYIVTFRLQHAVVVAIVLYVGASFKMFVGLLVLFWMIILTV